MDIPSTAKSLGIIRWFTVKLWWRNHALKLRRQKGPKVLPIGRSEIWISIEPRYSGLTIRDFDLRFVTLAFGFAAPADVSASVVDIINVEIVPRPGERVQMVFSGKEKGSVEWICRFNPGIERGPGLRLDAKVTVDVKQPFQAFLSGALLFPQIGRAFGRLKCGGVRGNPHHYI